MEGRSYAAALRRLHRQYEGRLRRCARAARDAPQSHGGCCCCYRSSVRSLQMGRVAVVRAAHRRWRQIRDTGHVCYNIRVRARRTLTRASVYGGPWRMSLVCVPRTRLEGPCVYTCRTHSGMTSVRSRKVVGRSAVASVRSPAPLGGRIAIPNTVRVFWGEDNTWPCSPTIISMA